MKKTGFQKQMHVFLNKPKKLITKYEKNNRISKTNACIFKQTQKA